MKTLLVQNVALNFMKNSPTSVLFSVKDNILNSPENVVFAKLSDMLILEIG